MDVVTACFYSASFPIVFQYIEIDVRNPRTHIENGKAQFTDYEISIQVRDDTFA